MAALLSAQRRRLTAAAVRLNGDEGEPASLRGVPETSTDEEIHVVPLNLVVQKPERGARHEPAVHSRSFDAAARVLPVEEDQVSRFTLHRGSVCCLPQDEWTVDSVDDAEQQQEELGVQ